MSRAFTHIITIIAIVMLSACGEEAEEARMPGERVSIMMLDNALEVDAPEDDEVKLGPERNSKAWPQEGLIPIHAVGQLKLASSINLVQSASVGDGNEWENILVAPPVIGDGKVFAMDARGNVSAHDVRDISEVLWVSDAVVDEDTSEVLGGGLAYANGRVFITSGYGSIVALDAATGTEKWRRNLSIPLRAPPTLIGTYLLALSVTNQLFAVNMTNGELVWSHQGVKESSRYLRVVAPAADKDYVIAPYSSGEVVALRLQNGRAVWGDTLTLPRRTKASAAFTGIGGNPIIAGDIMYAVSSSGLMVANSMADGRGIWERPISSLHTPWLAGDYIFVITAERKLIAMKRFTGQIRWVLELDNAIDAENFRLFDPVVVSGQVVITTNVGKLIRVDATDGTLLQADDIPFDVATSPIIADMVMYVITADAELHALK